LLTGVRTCELRLATSDQFDLERELWIIPPGNVKQLQRKLRKVEDIPPYIVPLSIQAMDVVRNLLRCSCRPKFQGATSVKAPGTEH
jgi:integrase